MLGLENGGAAGLDTVAHIIQEALTPVFLLSGIATLLNVFSTRLSRVADQVATVSKALETADTEESALLTHQLKNLYLRSVALDAAVVLGAVGGAATCGAVLVLFVGSLRDATNAWILFSLFGGAVVCALGGVVAFTAEMMMAGVGIRREVTYTRRRPEEAEPAETEAHPHPDPSPDGSGEGGGSG